MTDIDSLGSSRLEEGISVVVVKVLRWKRKIFSSSRRCSVLRKLVNSLDRSAVAEIEASSTPRLLLVSMEIVLPRGMQLTPLIVRCLSTGEKHSIQVAFPPAFSSCNPRVNSLIMSSTRGESGEVELRLAMAALASGTRLT